MAPALIVALSRAGPCRAARAPTERAPPRGPAQALLRPRPSATSSRRARPGRSAAGSRRPASRRRASGRTPPSPTPRLGGRDAGIDERLEVIRLDRQDLLEVRGDALEVSGGEERLGQVEAELDVAAVQPRTGPRAGAPRGRSRGRGSRTRPRAGAGESPPGPLPRSAPRCGRAVRGSGPSSRPPASARPSWSPRGRGPPRTGRRRSRSRVSCSARIPVCATNRFFSRLPSDSKSVLTASPVRLTTSSSVEIRSSRCSSKGISSCGDLAALLDDADSRRARGAWSDSANRTPRRPGSSSRRPGSTWSVESRMRRHRSYS